MSYVWYAGFGSNLSAQRLSKYIQGGCASGATRPERGARNPTLPTHSDSFASSHPLYFALESSKWGGGGVAFISPEPRPDSTDGAKCHLHRITKEQFGDIYAQENRQPGPIDLEVDLLSIGPWLDLLEGAYGRIVVLGTHANGEPIVTFTSAVELAPNPPNEPYLEVMRSGLREAFGLGESKIADYLERAIGRG